MRPITASLLIRASRPTCASFKDAFTYCSLIVSKDYFLKTDRPPKSAPQLIRTTMRIIRLIGKNFCPTIALLASSKPDSEHVTGPKFQALVNHGKTCALGFQAPLRKFSLCFYPRRTALKIFFSGCYESPSTTALFLRPCDTFSGDSQKILQLSLSASGQSLLASGTIALYSPYSFKLIRR